MPRAKLRFTARIYLAVCESFSGEFQDPSRGDTSLASSTWEAQDSDGSEHQDSRGCSPPPDEQVCKLVWLLFAKRIQDSPPKPPLRIASHSLWITVAQAELPVQGKVACRPSKTSKPPGGVGQTRYHLRIRLST